MIAIDRLQRAGFSRAEIARRSGVSPQLIGMYERGRRFPSRKTFERLVALAESRGLTLLASDFLTSHTKPSH
jgi:transcriptional regulator with XRE-family HTH domain